MPFSFCRNFLSICALCTRRRQWRLSRNFHLSSRRFSKSAETDLMRQLKAKIKLSGPLTVAQYMKEVLINPVAGYYMHRDVFGSQGDFITSPEISQMFGELLGVWCVNEWLENGSPNQLQVVELGPGRGTLASDMLRVFNQFKELQDRVSFHLVEVSSKLSEIQADRLGQPGSSHTEVPPGGKSYMQCYSQHGVPVSWYSQLQDVPRGFSLYVAHEFFDALPIHKFQKKDGRWHEVLIDLDEASNSDSCLRYVLSGGSTPALALLHQEMTQTAGDHLEICPQGGAIVQHLSERVSMDGGSALLVDYGHSGEKTDTFRAFRQHQLYDPLREPGTADLTADVNFKYLKKAAGNNVCTHGPVTQSKFLHEMGIGVRMQVLMGKANSEERTNLATGYDMLTNPDKMGERFKMFAILQNKGGSYIPAGFAPTQ